MGVSPNRGAASSYPLPESRAPRHRQLGAGLPQRRMLNRSANENTSKGTVAENSTTYRKPAQPAQTQTPKDTAHRGQYTSSYSSAEHLNSAISRKRQQRAPVRHANTGYVPSRQRPMKRIIKPPHPPRGAQPLPTLPASLPPPSPPPLPAYLSGSPLSSAASRTRSAQPSLTAAAAVTSSLSQQQIAGATRLRKLHATATLLQALNVRNRNQHRGQGWWKRFSMLRRKLVELVGIEVGLWEARYGDVGGKMGSETKGLADGGAGGVKGSLRPVNSSGVEAMKKGAMSQAEQMRSRLALEEQLLGKKVEVERWLREVVVPKAWVAFTALLGDGAFAGLGVVLMGVLGDVAGLVGGCEEFEEVTGGNAASDDVRPMDMTSGGIMIRGEQVRRKMHDSSPEQPHLRTNTRTIEDMGEVVERREAPKGTIMGNFQLEAGVGLRHAREDADATMQDYDTNISFSAPSSPIADLDSLGSNIQNDPKESNDESQGQVQPKENGQTMQDDSSPATDENITSHEVLKRRKVTESAASTKARRTPEKDKGRTASRKDLMRLPTQSVAQTASEVGSDRNTGLTTLAGKSEVRSKADGRDRDISTGEAKVEKKQKRKRKNENAIDELFAGFA